MKKTGGVMSTPGIEFALSKATTLPPYELEYHQKVLKSATLPSVLVLPETMSLRFHDKQRDNFFDMCTEAKKRRQWTQSLQITGSVANTQVQGAAGAGFAGYKKNVEQQSNYNQAQITNAFQDLDSLKERSKGMVTIAEQIKAKLARKELDAESDEVKEI